MQEAFVALIHGAIYLVIAGLFPHPARTSQPHGFSISGRDLTAVLFAVGSWAHMFLVPTC
jgi:hypothetical protein